VLRVVNTATLAASTLLLVAAAGNVVLRLVRARGILRRQLEWLAWAGAVLAALWLVSALVTWGALGHPPPLVDALSNAVGLAVVPAAVGVAILRHRLYDIDRLLARTLVYGLVTLPLAAAYAVVVLGLGQLLGRDSSLAVAAATLAAAAAFQPLRRRVQASVDRRFNRRRYDASLAVAAFATRLREHVDLDTLTSELLGVVERTTEPAGAGLWLRPR
jgi:hypothetical protein